MTGTGTCRSGSSGCRISSTADRSSLQHRLRRRGELRLLAPADADRRNVPPAEAPAGGTTALAAFGFAVIAVHIVDDNFVQPQPGTSARDHLVSGLVPLAVLAFAVVAYPRLQRRWSRGRRVGAGGVRHRGWQRGRLLHDRPGPLGRRLHRAPVRSCAGVVLLVVGAVTLWTTRRGDGTRRRRYARRAPDRLAGACSASTSCFRSAISYVSTHVGRLPANGVDLGGRVRRR